MVERKPPISLSFLVRSKKSKKMVKPRWVEATVENSVCPKCSGRLLVVAGDATYGYCLKCEKAFLGEPDED